jgi:hypothetical protein
VFTALALNEVPIDVLAERMDTTRGALYKTLHDARAKLRGADADARVPGMREHLAGCPACHDEHESLRALLS